MELMESNASSRAILEFSPASVKLNGEKFAYNTIASYITEKMNCGGVTVPPTKNDISEIKKQLDTLIDELMEQKRGMSVFPEEESTRPAEGVVAITKIISSISGGGWLQVNRIEPSPAHQLPQDDVVLDHRGNQHAGLKIDAVRGDRMYDSFLNFTRDLTSETKMDYTHFKRSDANESLKIVAIVVWIAFGASLVQVHALTPANGAYVAALVAASIALLASSMSLLPATALVLARLELSCGCNAFDDFAGALLSRPHRRWVENALVLFGQLASSLLLLADSMESRARHRLVELSPDLAVTSMTFVLLSQIFCKGASNTIIALSWVASIVVTNICLSLVGSTLYFWINAVYLFLLMTSYELERQTLRHFIKSILAVEATEKIAGLQIQLANQQIREGQKSLEAKRSVVRHVGHEIRGPLNTIGIGVDILAEELAYFRIVPRSITDIVCNMRDAAASALETVNELLAFEKIAAGMNTIEPSKQAIVPYIRECMKSHAIPAMAKSIKFELVVEDGCDEDIWVNIDPVKCKIVFRNLFSNAIKFSRSDSLVTVKMVVTIDTPGVPIGGLAHCEGTRGSADLDTSSTGNKKSKFVVITCTDNGAGLSKEDLNMLFQEGKQFNANSLQGGGGSGFGLFITKGLVEQHKNTSIWCESEGEGCGCRFVVKFPVVKRMRRRSQTSSILSQSGSNDAVHVARMAAVERFQLAVEPCQLAGVVEGCEGCEDPNPSDHDKAASPQKLPSVDVADSFHAKISVGDPILSPRFVAPYNPNALNILIVDDSPANRKMVGRLLKMDGHHCVEAMDGLTAVGAVSRTLLRRLNGDHIPPFDVVLIDKNMPIMSGPDATREMRKLGFTRPIIGITGSEEHEDFILAGANAVMVKPINKASLMAAITAAMATAGPKSVSVSVSVPVPIAPMEMKDTSRTL